MDLSRPIRFVALAALCGGLGTPVLAQDDCINPITLGEKPAMGAYADYSDFLVAVMEHKGKEESRRRHQKMCPELYQEPPLAQAPAQTLEGAIQESARRPAFDYGQHQSWYNRTTSRSFGLPGMANATMSGEAINTSLTTLEQGALDERLRGILLALQSPLSRAGLTDGASAADIAQRQLSDVLILREAEVLAAFSTGSYGDRLESILFSGGGQGAIVLYLGADEILDIDGSAEVESCFSSCGDFGLTFRFRP